MTKDGETEQVGRQRSVEKYKTMSQEQRLRIQKAQLVWLFKFRQFELVPTSLTVLILSQQILVSHKEN